MLGNMTPTHSPEPVPTLLIKKDGNVEHIVIGQPLLSDERWLVVLMFKVGGGATDLIAHLVVPTPPDWYDLRERKPRPVRDAAMRHLIGIAKAAALDAAPGRLTTALVRSSSTMPLERWARGYIAEMENKDSPTLLFRPGTTGLPNARPRGPVRGQWERNLLLYAARYVELTHQADVATPVATLAAEMNVKRGTVQSYLYKCRHEFGLLTSEGRGQARGELTPKARALLNAINSETEGRS
jgi:hypothetical protein